MLCLCTKTSVQRFITLTCAQNKSQDSPAVRSTQEALSSSHPGKVVEPTGSQNSCPAPSTTRRESTYKGRHVHHTSSKHSMGGLYAVPRTTQLGHSLRHRLASFIWSEACAIVCDQHHVLRWNMITWDLSYTAQKPPLCSTSQQEKHALYFVMCLTVSRHCQC